MLGLGSRYFVKTPLWLMKLFPRRLWKIKTREKIIYLTFDDGPDPAATNFVLDQLKRFDARATFFCIGKNVKEFPDVYKRIVAEGHQTGNHSYSHLNGWKTDNKIYIADIKEAGRLIHSRFYRPPYGRMRSAQAKQLNEAMERNDGMIVMWDVLSGDFDPTLSREKCRENVIRNVRQGSIVVFHDSAAAFQKLEADLPDILAFFSDKGYSFRAL